MLYGCWAKNGLKILFSLIQRLVVTIHCACIMSSSAIDVALATFFNAILEFYISFHRENLGALLFSLHMLSCRRKTDDFQQGQM